MGDLKESFQVITSILLQKLTDVGAVFWRFSML